MTSILSERKDEDVDVLRLLSDTQNLALGTAIGVGVQMTYVVDVLKHSNDDSISLTHDKTHSRTKLTHDKTHSLTTKLTHSQQSSLNHDKTHSQH